MIKRIQSLKNFGVYNDYKHSGNLRDFNYKNIFYGWNYSGKTTLSRLFQILQNKALNGEDYQDVEFEIALTNGNKITQKSLDTFPHPVRVFNSDFIRENLKFDSEDKKIKGITFDIGENAHLRPLIKSNEDYIEKANKIISNNSKFIKEFNQFSESKFTKQAKIIKLDHFNSLIEFNKSHLEKLIDKKEVAVDKIISSEDDLLKVKADSIAINNKEKIEVKDYASSFGELSKSVSDFIAREPQVAATIALLDEDDELYDWVNKGLVIHTAKQLNDCAFCNSEIKLDRVIDLNAYYTNEAAKLKDDSIALLKLLDDEIKLFESVIYINISKNDVSESLQSDFQKLMDKYGSLLYKYNALLFNLKYAVHDKVNKNIFTKQVLKDFDRSVVEELSNWYNDLKEVINQHNTIIENFKQNQDSAREKYKSHLVFQYLIDEDYFEIKRKKEIEERFHEKILNTIKFKEEENKDHLDKLKSITAGKSKLNEFIKLFLKRDDIQIDVVADDFFVLKRGDVIAKNLSEGEKTAIAFSHFMVLLDSLHNDGKLLDTIIFIDDPISSLDANHIAQVSSLINSFFFRKNVDSANPDKVVECYLQLFISTHNFEFYSFLRDANNLKRKRKDSLATGDSQEQQALNSYLVKKQTVTSSTIINLPSSLTSFKSEYTYLFSIIYEFFESGCSEENTNYILMPNAIRRFLEIYTLIKLPGNNGEIDSRVKELVSDVNELKILHHFSHFTTFEKATKHDELILKLPDLTEDVFTLLKKDESHYSSLCKAINKPKK